MLAFSHSANLQNMKIITTHFTLAIIAVCSAHSADTPSARELRQLTETHQKAVSAAVAPLTARYQSFLQLLLKRAMQSNDLDTALQIRQLLAPAATTPATPTAAATLPQPALGSPDTKRELEKALIGTTWAWSGAKEGEGSGRVVFSDGGKAQLEGQNYRWEVTGKRSIKFDGQTTQFDDTLTKFECNWHGRGTRYGKRKAP